jgi:hypothetical protein
MAVDHAKFATKVSGGYSGIPGYDSTGAPKIHSWDYQ